MVGQLWPNERSLVADSTAALELDADAALALVEEKGAIGVWNWDLDDDRLEWSAGMFRILGLIPFSLRPTLQLYLELVHPDDRIELHEPAPLAGSGDIAERCFRIIRPDGEMRWIRSSGRIVHRRNGTPSRMMGAAFDITELRRGLESRQQEVGLVGAARELLGGTVWKTDAEGATVDPMAWPPVAGIGGRYPARNRLEDVHPEDRQQVLDAWDTALRSRSRFAAEYRALWQGKYALIASRATPIRDARGETTAWIGCNTVRQLLAEPIAATRPAARAAAAGVAPIPSIAPAQVRAARAFLDWTARDLAKRAGVSFSTARRAESPDAGPLGRRAATAIRQAFEEAGIRFTTDPDGTLGISLRA